MCISVLGVVLGCRTSLYKSWIFRFCPSSPKKASNPVSRTTIILSRSSRIPRTLATGHYHYSPSISRDNSTTSSYAPCRLTILQTELRLQIRPYERQRHALCVLGGYSGLLPQINLSLCHLDLVARMDTNPFYSAAGQSRPPETNS